MVNCATPNGAPFETNNFVQKAKIVPSVCFYTKLDCKHKPDPLCQWVAPNADGDCHAKKCHGHKLKKMFILCHPHKWCMVFVVNTVDVAIQGPGKVVETVPIVVR